MTNSFIVAAVVAALAGTGLSVLVKRMIDSERAENQSFEIVCRLQEVNASSHSAISNLRAFILDGTAASSAAFSKDLGDANHALDRYNGLHPNWSDGIVLRRDLQVFSARSGHVIQQRQELGAASVPMLAEDGGLEAAIRGLENDLESCLNSRNSVLDTEKGEREKQYLLTEIAFGGTMLFGTLALLIAGIGLQREAAQRRLAEARHASAKHELSTVQAMLQLQEKKDVVTGILNRAAFEEILAQEYEKCSKNRSPLSVVLVELDQLRTIQEARGKEIADMVISQAAGILRECFRGGDICCRFSETEFGVVLPRTSLENASIAAERARQALGRAEWPNCTVTASIGVAQSDYFRDWPELVTRVEQAVDYARRTGRNRVKAIRAYLPMSA